MQRPLSYSNDILTTIQDYMKYEIYNVWVYHKKLKKRHKISFSLPTTSRNTSKSLRSSFANLIHQFDASIASKVIEFCMLEDIPVYTVHDNFITNALFASKMHPFYIDAFLAQLDPLSIINRLLFDNLLPNGMNRGATHADGIYGGNPPILTSEELEAILNANMPPNLESRQRNLWNKHCDALISYYLSFAKEVGTSNGELSTQCYLRNLREFRSLMRECKLIGYAVHP